MNSFEVVPCGTILDLRTGTVQKFGYYQHAGVFRHDSPDDLRNGVAGKEKTRPLQGRPRCESTDMTRSKEPDTKWSADEQAGGTNDAA